MITFISATPGSGKTLLATDMVYQISRRNVANLHHNFFYGKAFFEKIKELQLEEYFQTVYIEHGQGLEKEIEVVFLEDDYFDFLKKKYHINVVLDGETDDLIENFPSFYYERLAVLNVIIENINNDHKTKFLKFKPVQTIYTNIENLRLSQARSLPADMDWRKCPQGSLFVIDEAQLIPIFSEDAKVIDAIVKELTKHRHKGYDFIFITQYPSFVNKYIRLLSTRHIHLINIFGWEQSMRLEWSTVQENPNAIKSLARTENVSRWIFPKYAYKLYKSTTIDTREKRYPKKMIFLIILAVIVFGAAIFMLTRGNSTVGNIATGHGLKFEEKKDESKTNQGTKQTAVPSQNGSALDASSASESAQNSASNEKIQNIGINAASSAANGNLPVQSEPVYDPADPYAYVPVSRPAVVNYRVFSGCVSYSGKHYAVDQQGTIIKQFSASDCKKLLDKSYNRPFDYFGNRTPPPPPVEQPAETDGIEQESAMYKKFLIENKARIDSEKQLKAQNAEVREEPVPFGEPKSKYFDDAANRY